MRGSAIERTIQKELAHYPGVDHEIRNGGKHKRLVFHRDGQSRFLTLSRTPSDWRAQQNALRDFKRTMSELGAQRLDVLPGQTTGLRKMDAVARITLNDKGFSLSIPASSPLIRRFKTPEGKAVAHWRFELRASPDLQAPPMLAAIEAEVPAGKKVAVGIVAGFLQPNTGGWRVTAARSSIPALSKMVERIRAVDVELYEEKANELIFKLPTGLLPTRFQARKITPAEEAKVEALVERDERELQPAPAPAAAPVMLNEQPITLQLPKQGVSIEAAIGVLNKAKRRLGSNLKFTITEGGFLTAVHRIGS